MQVRHPLNGTSLVRQRGKVHISGRALFESKGGNIYFSGCDEGSNWRLRVTLAIVMEEGLSYTFFLVIS